jgi:hypothetical protein
MPSSGKKLFKVIESMRLSRHECKGHLPRDSSEPRASLVLPAGFLAVMPERSVSLGNEFGAPALDEIAGFCDDVLQYFDQLADAGFAINHLSS